MEELPLLTSAPRRRGRLVAVAALLVGACAVAAVATRQTTSPWAEFEAEGPNGDDLGGGIDYKHVTASIGYQEGASHANPVEDVDGADPNPIIDDHNATTKAQHHKHNRMFPR